VLVVVVADPIVVRLTSSSSSPSSFFDMRPWALITPASRGIGLALTRRVLQTTRCSVVATARTELDKAREDILRDLEGVDESRLKVLNVDVTGTSFPRHIFLPFSGTLPERRKTCG